MNRICIRAIASLMGMAFVFFATPSQAVTSEAEALQPEKANAASSFVRLALGETVTLESGTTVTHILPPEGAEAPAPNFDGDFNWWGYRVKFSKSETRGIAAGAGSCSVIVGKLPSLPSKILSAGCGLLAVWAGYVLSSGDCVSVDVRWNGSFAFGRWNC